MTMEELAKRFLQITKKLMHVAEEKNFLLLQHCLLERNDIIELINASQEEMTPEGMIYLQEAQVLQNNLDCLMEDYRAELIQARIKIHQNHQVNRKYQENYLTGNAIRR